MIARTRIVSVGVAASTVVAAFGPGLGSELAEDHLPPPPPVRALGPTEPVVPDDGLHHLVITIPRSTTDAPLTSPPAGGTTVQDKTFALTAEMLAALPDGVALTAEGGVLGYRHNGRLVALGPVSAAAGNPGSSAPSTGPEPADIESTVVAERLQSLPGVKSVAAITDTSYAVVAASLDVFDELGATVNEDGFLAFSGDPYEPYQWSLDNRGDNLDTVSMPSVPEQHPDADVDGLEALTGASGAGVVVAVVDSGVDFDHPDLTGSAWVNPGEDCDDGSGNGIDDDGNGFVDDCVGWDFGNDDPTGYDGTNRAHGTHVAGIITAEPDNGIGIAGLAPEAAIMDLRVDSSDGVIHTSAVARAIRYAVDNGADIINLSVGSQPGAAPETVTEIADAAAHAAANGVLLVVAAGNNAVSLDEQPVYPASLDAANMIVVGATTPADGPAGFSNTGSPVDVFAPGEFIVSTVPNGGLAFHSGTSQAAPLVAAAAALVLDRDPSLSPAAVAQLLEESGDGNDRLAGLGAGDARVNAAAAIGIEPADDPIVSSGVTISGLADHDDGLLSANISLNVNGGQFNQPFHWEASLVNLIEGDPYAVIGHDVATGSLGVSVASGASTAPTDKRGSVYLAAKDATEAGWSTELPDGEYALVVEAVPDVDSAARLGNAYIATFTVDGVGGDEATAPDGSSGGGDGAGGDTGPGPVTESGGGSSDGGDPTTTGAGSDGDQTPARGGTTDPDDNSDGAGSDDGDTEGVSDAEQASDPEDGVGPVSEGPDDPATNEDGSDDGDSGADDDRDGSGEDATDSDGSDRDGTDSDGSDRDGTDSDRTGSDGGDGDGVELGPDQAESGEWQVSEIEPRTGPVDTENMVQIRGAFPRSVEVWFDDNPGYVEFQSDDLLLVWTGRHERAGAVDVTLVTKTGEPALNLPHAYAFVSQDTTPPRIVDPGAGQPGVDGSGDSGDAGTQDPGFDLDPGDGIIVDGPPPPAEDPDGSGDVDLDRRRSRNRQSRSDPIGRPKKLDNGLTVVRLDGLSEIGDVPGCHEDVCNMTVFGLETTR